MHRFLSVLIFMLVTFSAVGAQEGYPLPTDLQPITPANAAQIRQLASIGGDLPGGLVWSPDGKLLAAGTSAGVKVYDANDWGKAPLEVAGGQDVLFSPDGSRLLSGGKLWDTKTWQAVTTIGDSEARIFSPSGMFLLTSRTERGLVILDVWDGKDGFNRGSLNTQSDLAYRGAVFSPEESRVAVELQSTRQNDPPPVIVQVWNMQTETLVSTLKNDFDTLDRVTFLFGRELLLTASHEGGGGYGNPEGSAVVWSVESGKALATFSDAFDVVISPDEAIIAYDQINGIKGLYLDSFDRFALSYNRPNEKEPAPITHPKISPDGRWLVINSEEDFGLLLWDAHADQLAEQPLTILTNPEYANDYVFNPDGSIMAVEGDSTIYLWDMNSERLQNTLDVGAKGFEAQFSPDGQILRATVYGQGDRLWDMATLQELPPVKANSLYSPNWNYAAYWDQDQVRVADVRSGNESALSVLNDYLGNVAALNPASGKIAFTGNGVQIYDARSGQQITRFEDDNPFVTFSPDGKHLATYTNLIGRDSGRDFTVWDTNQPDAQPIFISSTNGDPLFSPDGTLFALRTFADEGGGVYDFYDSQTGENLVAAGNQRDISSYAFSSDGTLVAGGSHLASMALWDVNAMLQAGETLPEGKRLTYDLEPLTHLGLNLESTGYGMPVSQIVFSPDGMRIAFMVDDSGSGDPVPTHDITYLVNIREWLKKGSVVHQDDIDVKVFDNMESPLFSPDGSYLLLKQVPQAAGVVYEGFKLIDTQTGAEVGTIPAGDLGVFSPDTSLIATYGSDGITLWNASTLVTGSQTPLVTLANADKDIKEVAFSADGTLLFARSNNRVSVWGVSGEAGLSGASTRENHL